MTEAPPGPRVGQGRRPAVRRPWPRLPKWFVAVVVASLAGFAVLAVLALQRMNPDEQPVFERRSPPRAGEMSHDVVAVTLPDAPVRDVGCGVVTGLRVQGGDVAAGRLEEAVRGLCDRLNGVDPALADRIVAAAAKRTTIVFGRFASTAEFSTTLAGPEPKVVLNDALLVQFKGFLLPVLAHELWHGGETGVTAEEELAARKIEDAMCRYVPSREAFRGCLEAAEFVALGDAAALAGLRAAGYR